MKPRTTGTQILERKFKWEIITQNEDHQVLLQVNPNSKRSTQIPLFHGHGNYFTCIHRLIICGPNQGHKVHQSWAISPYSYMD
ncbi:hypothetical protein FH972_010977 [Carpinus fangiana]|uniref:Uncharacterized protein n=1 Tax=Carpinus fangiana TaxID=176857 RepID=A0A660KW05_9ROSI|nr:hypothetical protein FH972_010977 [Carpinus fangiana]